MKAESDDPGSAFCYERHLPTPVISEPVAVTLTFMDIHAPHQPVHTFKDFAIHIAIVTIGIIIALSLDGLRETFREHRLVRETRENFRKELQADQHHMVDELARVTAGHNMLEALSNDAPALAQQHPEQIVARLESIDNPYYFFATNSWQSALSTGALGHVGTDEVLAYASAAEGTRMYVGLQTKTANAESRALAFWRAHPHPTPDQVTEGEERILLFAREELMLANIAPQVQNDYQKAVDAASR